MRDRQLSLGMLMSEFAEQPKPLFDAPLRLRAAVLGPPAQMLSLVDAWEAGGDAV